MKKTDFSIIPLFLLMLFLPVLCLSAQDGSGFALAAEPSLLIPMPGTTSAARFGIGGGASLGADYIPPGLSFLSFGASVDYLLVPHSSGNDLQMIGATADLGLRLAPLPGLQARLWGRGGLGLGLLGSATATTPYARAGLDVDLYLSPSFRLGLRASYDQLFAATEPLYQGLAATLSVGYNFSQANRRSKVEIRDIIILPVFPVFYKYYDDNPVGSIKVFNGEEGPIEDLRVSFFIKQYMDAPTECVSVKSLRRGESLDVSLKALFSRAILGVLESTKAQAEITVSYRFAGRAMDSRIAAAALVNHRNGMTWDDDRKAASFVTVNDPAVLRLSKSAASLSRSASWQALDLTLREAAGVFEAMRLFGLRYVIDPNTPHADYEKDVKAVDYLQFPGQTLEYRSGDCDDLSILSAALFEAAGIESAFITVPGHIYVAVALAMPPDQAKAFFLRPEDFIYQDGKAWLPVEVTAVQEGFLRAWQLGAREWRDAAAAAGTGEGAKLLPIHEAWRLYEPVAAPAETKIDLPKADDMLSRYEAAMSRFVEAETAPRLEAMKASISAAAAKKDPKVQNRVGVLYARYGLLEKAESAFRESNKVQENAAAWCNLGNVFFSKNDFRAALSAYKSAQRLSQNDPKVLAGLARAAYELDDRSGAASYLAALAVLDKAAAERLAYIGGGGVGASSTGRAGGPGGALSASDWKE